jgi:hypothetical protein
VDGGGAAERPLLLQLHVVAPRPAIWSRHPDVGKIGQLPENTQFLKCQYGGVVMRGKRLGVLSKQQVVTGTKEDTKDSTNKGLARWGDTNDSIDRGIWILRSYDKILRILRILSIVPIISTRNCTRLKGGEKEKKGSDTSPTIHSHNFVNTRC